MKNDKPRAKDSEDVLAVTAEVVMGFVRHNAIPAGDIPDLIRSVHATLTGLDGGRQIVEPRKPAIAVRKSVTPDYIICLEDGRKLKMLTRYLRSHYQLSPDEYRAKWNLPLDYPMVAPNYAAQRSDFAKKIGLGRASTRRRRSHGRL
jgi:predicted transcriptional regulator